MAPYSNITKNPLDWKPWTKESLFMWKYTNTYPINNSLTSSDYVHFEMSSLKLPAVSDLICLQSIYLGWVISSVGITVASKKILLILDFLWDLSFQNEYILGPL